MAKAKVVKKGKGGKGRQPSSGRMLSPASRILLILTSLALVPFMLPELLVLSIGMLPTLAATVGARGFNRGAWVCVGGLNLAGLLPWMMPLMFGNRSLDFAVAQVTDINMLLSSFGCAGLGWGLYLSMPPLVTVFSAMTAHRRAGELATKQRKLVEKWGEAVKGIDKAR
jgi:hypothetical protein